jgi:hypothetical protein
VREREREREIIYLTTYINVNLNGEKKIIIINYKLFLSSGCRLMVVMIMMIV